MKPQKMFLLTAMVSLGLSVGYTANQAKDDRAEVALQAALKKETIDGDLRGAIEQYKRIAQSGNRAVAAKALVRMGECYEKLGDAESRKAYERVLRDYADQKEAARLARARLGMEKERSDGRMSFRQVWKLPNLETVDRPISRDGRYLAYVDWKQNGNLFLHDFRSDTDRRLTDTATDRLPGPKVEQFAEEHSFSRDGRQLAYSWFREGTRGGRFELRLMDVKGDGIPQSRLLFDNQDVDWIAPFDWSPDGKSIAVSIQRKDKTGQIGLVSVPDGALRVLKSIDWRGTSMLVFSPDGKYLAYDLPASANTEQRDIFVLAADASREIPAVVSSSQDTVVGWSNDGKRLLFASDRSGSVGLWSVVFGGGKVDGPPELLRRDIGQISSLGFTDAGKLHVQIDSSGAGGDVHVAAVDFATGKQISPPSVAVQTYVGNNQFPAWSPDGKYLAYASRRGSIGPQYFVIAIRSTVTNEVRELSPSPGLDLVHSLIWALDGSVVVKGRDTKGHYGFFSVDAQSGRTSVLVTQEDGETLFGVASISADRKKLFYGKCIWELSNARPAQEACVWIEKDLTTGNQKELTRSFNMGKVSPNGQYLSISGRPNAPRTLNVRPTTGGELRELADEIVGPQVGGASWAPDSSAIYALKVSGELWRFPIDGSDPRKVDLKLEGNNLNIGPFSMHPDGQRIAFGTRPTEKQAEIWVLENFLPTLSAKK